MIKEGELFGKDTFYSYINGHTKNDCDLVFNSLKLLYRKQNFFIFDNCCGILNTTNNVEVIQMFHENYLTWNYSSMVSMIDLNLKLSTSIKFPGEKRVGTYWLLSRVPWQDRIITEL